MEQEQRTSNRRKVNFIRQIILGTIWIIERVPFLKKRMIAETQKDNSDEPQNPNIYTLH